MDTYSEKSEQHEEPVGLYARIAAVAAEHPDRPAVVAGPEVLTFRELTMLAGTLGERLVRSGLPWQSPIGLYMPHGIPMVVGLVTALAVGSPYVPLDPALPAQRLRSMVEDADVGWVMTEEGQSGPGDWSVTYGEVVLSAVGRGDTDVSAACSAPGARPDDLAYVMFTSGTSGRPKAVEITHGNVLNLLDGLSVNVWAGVPHSRVAWNANPSFDASVQQWIRLCRGDTLVLVGEECRKDPAAMANLLVEHQVTDLDVVPSHLAHLLDELNSQKLPLRLFVGGEAPTRELWMALDGMTREYGLIAWNLYGPTECAVDSTAARIVGGSPTLGGPIAGVRTYVLDEQLRPVPDGAIGELYIAGAGVGRGYRGQPGRTAGAFLPDVFAGDGGRMYRTGDLVRRRGDRDLVFVGRRDRQVKVRGHRIELDDVEAALGALPIIVDVAAVLRTDLLPGPGIVAYVVLTEQMAQKELRQQFAEVLPGYMLPASIVPMDALPLQPSGKTDYQGLPAPTARANVPTSGPGGRLGAYASDTEELLAALWGEILGHEHVAADDDFFDLGGDSLIVSRMLNRFREMSGARVKPRVMFDNPVLRDFAKAVQELLRTHS
ncbi:amino acid adenylation domain-containing protein [Streptomyces lavenduligriseus]|nr:amino acid adenylation domain-containing protein [Streptomyces lavenduligriseus]